MARHDMIPLTQLIYALSIGGSETLARRLALGLNGLGRYACSIDAVHGGGPLEAILRADGIPCMAFGRTGKWDLKPLMALMRRFRTAGTQIVHTHHIGQLLYGGLAGRLTGVRVVHTEHDFYSLDHPKARRLLRVLTTFADRVTAVAEPVREFLERRVGVPRHKLVTIENGVNIEQFATATPLNRAALSCEADDFVIGCIGRLSPEKGHAVLVRAFARLRARHARVRLLLAGDGEERPGLERLAAEHRVGDTIRFLGFRADIPQLLAACDAIVLPSIQEGFPMVVLEALAAGKAVIASHVGVIPRVVSSGETGLLVPPGDVAALADAMSLLLSDPVLRRTCGEAGCALVRDRFGFSRTVAAYDALYRSVLNRPQPVVKGMSNVAAPEVLTTEEKR